MFEAYKRKLMMNNHNNQEKRIFAHEVATELTEKEMKDTTGGVYASGPKATAEDHKRECLH
jgi:hypothetical protein